MEERQTSPDSRFWEPEIQRKLKNFFKGEKKKEEKTQREKERHCLNDPSHLGEINSFS